jgi:predicted RNase H-like nuclease (RuvC/YqgF family)
LGDDIDQQLTIGDMLNTINKLKVKLSEKEKEVENLYIYKEKFFKLKELI